jgi:hypothetical protein
MITIFGDFSQFSVKKLAFFSKTNVMIHIFAKSNSSLCKKRQLFRQILGENISAQIGDPLEKKLSQRMDYKSLLRVPGYSRNKA